MSRDDEIADVYTKDRRKGSHERLTKRQRERLLDKFEVALQSNDWKLFDEAIHHGLGLKPGTDEYDHAVRVWKNRHHVLR